MTEQAEGHYFASRELAERVMSSRADNWRAAEAHKELADRYEALALVFGAKPRSQVEFDQVAVLPNHYEKRENGELDQLDAELTRSLDRCRKLLFDFRSELAANAYMPELLDDQREEMHLPRG
jgi:hypothetical protein